MDRTKRFRQVYNYLRDEGFISGHKDIAEAMHSSRSNVSMAYNGHLECLTDRFITRFCSAYKTINVNWLLTGDGKMLNDSITKNKDIENTESNLKTNSVDILVKHVGQLIDRLNYQINRLDEREKILDKREQDIYDRLQQAEKILNSAIQIRQNYPESLNTIVDKKPIMASEPFNEIKPK